MKRLIRLKSTEAPRIATAELRADSPPISSPPISSPPRAEKLLPIPQPRPEKLKLNLKPLKASQRRKELDQMIDSLHRDNIEISRRRRDHRLNSSIGVTIHLYNDSSYSGHIGEVSELDISVPSIPHSRKNPPSLYNSSKNTSSFEPRHKRQEIMARIERVEGLLGSSSKRHEIKQSLLAAFSVCVETEAKSYYPVWVKVLESFEAVVSEFNAKMRHAASPTVLESSKYLEEVNLLLSKDLEIDDPREDTMFAVAKDLSVLWKTVVRSVTNSELQGVLETVWSGVTRLINKSITSQNSRISKALEGIQEQAKAEKLQLQRMLEGMVGLWEGKLVRHKQAAAKQEIEALQRTIHRLHKDLEQSEELLRDRDAEIESLRRPTEMRNVSSTMAELTRYLEETEERHSKQAEILAQIGEMISPRLSRKNKSKKTIKLRPTFSLIPQISPEQLRNLPNLKSPAKLENSSDRFQAPVSALLPSKESSSDVEKVRSDAESPATQDRSPAKFSSIASVTFVSPQDSSPSPQGSSPGPQGSSPSPQDSSDSECEPQDAQTQTELSMQAEAELTRAIGGLSPAASRAPSTHIFLTQLEKLPKKSPPMSDINFFKLFELAMDEKAKADELDLLMKKPLRTTTEFMLDFLFMQYGLKSLALKNLSSLVNSLERMSRNEHRYGTLFCRLLEIYTNKPIPLKLGTFLAKVRAAFVQIQAKSSSKQTIELGGEVLLTEVYDLLAKIFASVRPTQNLEIGRSVLERIRPDLPRLDKIAMLVCYRISRSGRDLKYLFLQIDHEKTGSICKGGFVQRLSHELDLYLAKEDVEELYDYLSEGAVNINFSIFSSRLAYKELMAQAKQVTVAKVDFLLAVLDEQEIRQERDLEYLKSLFSVADKNGSGVLTYQQFTEFLRSIDPNLTNEGPSIFREALELVEDVQNPDCMSCDAFCTVALKHNIGGKFDVLETTDYGQHDELVQLGAREVAVSFQRRNTHYRK
jgi:Ca2+-binding EF-hand superfamily protein/uncharacterized protein YukE